MIGMYPISIDLAEGDMLSQNAVNPGITMDLSLYLTNWCKVPCTIPKA